MKAIKVDYWTEKCGRCGALVTYTRGLGTYTNGASECYEDWETVEHKFCPECGEKVDRDESEI